MTNKENVVPIILAVLIHLVLLALLLWGFVFRSDENTKKQFVDSPVQAKLVTAPEIPKKNAASLKRRQQKEIDDAKKVIEKDKAEKQKLAEETKAAEQKANEDKAKELQAELDKELELKKQADDKLAQKKKLTDEKKKKADAEKKRLAEEKRKKDEAAKKKKAEAARKLKELEDQMASLDDELFEADKGDIRQGFIDDEVDRLTAAIASKVRRNWFKPVSEGDCKVSIQIGPGGVLLGTRDNGGDLDYCESGTLAIQKSAPFPSSDDPDVIQKLKNVSIRFDPTFKE